MVPGSGSKKIRSCRRRLLVPCEAAGASVREASPSPRLHRSTLLHSQRRGHHNTAASSLSRAPSRTRPIVVRAQNPSSLPVPGRRHNTKTSRHGKVLSFAKPWSVPARPTSSAARWHDLGRRRHDLTTFRRPRHVFAIIFVALLSLFAPTHILRYPQRTHFHLQVFFARSLAALLDLYCTLL